MAPRRPPISCLGGSGARQHAEIATPLPSLPSHASDSYRRHGRGHRAAGGVIYSSSTTPSEATLVQLASALGKSAPFAHGKLPELSAEQGWAEDGRQPLCGVLEPEVEAVDAAAWDGAAFAHRASGSSDVWG
mmetsp:Transcript_42666/g.106182  ORF Transcript_42666/g.106182 Transcript_42666/m.106182 type:complete len:132 (-) Transcript_42666:217-612(-)